MVRVVDDTPFDDKNFLLTSNEVLRKQIEKLKIKCALLEVMAKDAKLKLKHHEESRRPIQSKGRDKARKAQSPIQKGRGKQR